MHGWIKIQWLPLLTKQHSLTSPTVCSLFHSYSLVSQITSTNFLNRKWVHCTQMASMFTRSQSNRATSGLTGDLFHGYATNFPSTTNLGILLQRNVPLPEIAQMQNKLGLKRFWHKDRTLKALLSWLLCFTVCLLIGDPQTIDNRLSLSPPAGHNYKAELCTVLTTLQLLLTLSNLAHCTLVNKSLQHYTIKENTTPILYCSLHINEVQGCSWLMTSFWETTVHTSFA